MPSTTFLLNGFSIIGDPQTTNTNASKGGNLMVHNGSALFEDNDILLFTVEEVTVDGVFTGDSYISGLVVYENASDYYNDIPKYTYTGTADVDTGRNNMGDRYLQTDASGLTSSDPGAPVLGDVAIIAGVNILETLATTNGPLVIPTNEDIDSDGSGAIEADEEGDGSFSSLLSELVVICFARGTLIETPDGPRFIETLREGDEVITIDAGPQPIRWIGHARVEGIGPNAPIRIARDALGNIRDLVISPNHRMLVRGGAAELMFGEHEVLVAAKHLVNGTTIVSAPCPHVDYWHFLCDAHHVVFAEGCPTETLYPGPMALNAVDEGARDEILGLLPEVADPSYAGPMARYAVTRFEAKALAEPAA